MTSLHVKIAALAAVLMLSAAPGLAEDAALDTDESFTQTFPAAGSIEYFCAIHPRMTGKIIVTPLNEARLKGVRLPTGWMWATRQIRIALPRCFCLTSSMPFGSPAGLPAAVPMPRISCRRLRSGPSKAFADLAVETRAPGR